LDRMLGKASYLYAAFWCSSLPLPPAPKFQTSRCHLPWLKISVELKEKQPYLLREFCKLKIYPQETADSGRKCDCMDSGCLKDFWPPVLKQCPEPKDTKGANTLPTLSLRYLPYPLRYPFAEFSWWKSLRQI